MTKLNLYLIEFQVNRTYLGVVTKKNNVCLVKASTPDAAVRIFETDISSHLDVFGISLSDIHSFKCININIAGEDIENSSGVIYTSLEI